MVQSTILVIQVLDLIVIWPYKIKLVSQVIMLRYKEEQFTGTKLNLSSQMTLHITITVLNSMAMILLASLKF